MTDNHTLLFMGETPETFRCRIYSGAEAHDPRVEFIRSLSRYGVIDCPAYDGWVTALQERGWLPMEPDLEPNPDGPGKIGRWLLTDKGREEAHSLGVLDG